MYKIYKDINHAMHQEFCSPEAQEYPKVHFTSSTQIAEEVREDLDARFGGGMTIDALITQNECTWDPGGMMFANDEEFSFDLEYITIKCLAQHFLSFEHQVNKRAKQPVRGNMDHYIKLHGAYSCICLTIDEFALLHDLVSPDNKAGNYHERANKAIDALINRVKQMNADLNQHYEAEHLAKSIDMDDKHNLN
jgi:hypothetical protein